jgi:hypothetical protein
MIASHDQLSPMALLWNSMPRTWMDTRLLLDAFLAFRRRHLATSGECRFVRMGVLAPLNDTDV